MLLGAAGRYVFPGPAAHTPVTGGVLGWQHAHNNPVQKAQQPTQRRLGIVGLADRVRHGGQGGRAV